MPPQAERKPNQVEQKVVDPEAELSNAVRTYLKLAPQCSVEKRAGGIPQLAPQEKQLSILAHELHETLLCINLARKGQHAVRDANVKSGTRKSIVEYEQLESVLRDERAQQAELDCLNYLAQKNVIELSKKVPTEADELGMIENANNRLRRMENRLDLATKRVCVVNADNKKEMQSFEGELNHLAKLEEFLRVKGSRRICEADEKEEIKRQEEIQACEQDIARHDALLEEIFAYAGSEKVPHIINHFQISEIENFSCFILLCQVLQESIILKREQEVLRQRICEFFRNSFNKIKKLSKCDCNALLALLGNHTEVTKWNVSKFLRILETEVKSLIQVVYGAVKPPAPTPKGRKGPPVPPSSRLVADPRVEIIRPNRIEKLVPYQPCAYCVEDYIMNLVFETPAVPATKEYIESIFHLEDVNTKFNIYTLTIPAKRHPFRGKKD
ncbi:hypothetical protein HF086_010974 [Spodoptera exigua]|uniref:ODAD1 central coiled coil region domain-containing protein n=1 Tax=Spodoptera exigua TaxID=7107 RepID=A0A922SJT7_SPOEX|nr:hypothetical protein HF086_010974 [Spodoptera exigua]